MDMNEEQSIPRHILIGSLSILLILAFYLRLVYVRRTSLFVDEFVSLWAAKMVLGRGVPIFPSGNFYSHGMLFTYLEAPFVGLLGFGEMVARMPSLFIGVLTLPVVYLLGKRVWGEGIGLLAATCLAWEPEAILWGGRARMYSLLQLLVLGMVLLFYKGAIREERVGYLYGAAFLFWAALFTQPEAILLVPAFFLAVWFCRGWRRLLSPGIVKFFSLSALGVLAIFVINRFGQPGQLETLQETRPFLLPTWKVGLRIFAPFFFQSWRLPFTLLFLTGIPLLVTRQRGKAGHSPRREGVVYLYIIFGTVILILLLLVGGTWQRPRYAFMVLPLFFLLSSWALSEIKSRFWPRLARSVPGFPKGWFFAIVAVAISSYIFLLGLEEAYQQEWGYDLAFRYLKERWQDGDVVLTVIPAASSLYLGQTDYFAIQRGYEEYIMERDGVLVDRWTGASPLTTTEELAEVLKENQRIWFVVDGWRLQTRYEVEFVELLLDQMALVYQERGAMVFFSEGYHDSPPPAVSRPLVANLDGRMMLRGYELLADEIDPGDELEVTLFWQALDPQKEYVVFLHLVGEDGERIAQDDKEPLQALYSPAFWPPEEVVRDRHRLPLPERAHPGLYRLDLGLYEAATQDRLSILGSKGEVVGDKMTLDFIHLSGGVVAEPSHRLEANLGGIITLLGYDLPQSKARPGEALPLTLYWRAEGIIDGDYTVFVHLVGDDGLIWGQEDSQPRHGFYPTSYWDPGDMVVDEHSVSAKPDAPWEEYRLLVGIYLLSTMERLPLLDETGEVISDFISLGEISVSAE